MTKSSYSNGMIGKRTPLIVIDRPYEQRRLRSINQLYESRARSAIKSLYDVKQYNDKVKQDSSSESFRSIKIEIMHDNELEIVKIIEDRGNENDCTPRSGSKSSKTFNFPDGASNVSKMIQFRTEFTNVNRSAVIPDKPSKKIYLQKSAAEIRSKFDPYALEKELLIISGILTKHPIQSEEFVQNRDYFVLLGGPFSLIRKIRSMNGDIRGNERLITIALNILRLTLIHPDGKSMSSSKRWMLHLNHGNVTSEIEITIEAMIVVVESMKNYSRTQEVLANGCALLYTLMQHYIATNVPNNSNNVATSNIPEIEREILFVATDALQKFHFNCDIQKWGSNIIWFNMRHGYHKNELLDRMVIPLLKRVLGEDTHYVHHNPLYFHCFLSRFMETRVRSTIQHLERLQTCRQLYLPKKKPLYTIYDELDERDFTRMAKHIEFSEENYCYGLTLIDDFDVF